MQAISGAPLASLFGGQLDAFCSNDGTELESDVTDLTLARDVIMCSPASWAAVV